MESCQRDRDEPTSDGQRVNHWLIEKPSPYARNPRPTPTRKSLRSPSAPRGLSQNPSLVYTKVGIIAGPRAHARRAKAPAQRRSRHWSKISVLLAGFVLLVIATAILTTYRFPKTGAREPYSP